MTITKQDINAVLTRLTEAFPQAFVLEQYQPHRPLKVGIFSEIAARCPDLARSDLVTVLNIYTRRRTTTLGPAIRETVPYTPRPGWPRSRLRARPSAPRQRLGRGPRNRQQLWLRCR